MALQRVGLYKTLYNRHFESVSSRAVDVKIRNISCPIIPESETSSGQTGVIQAAP